jgi:hypothetical protein
VRVERAHGEQVQARSGRLPQLSASASDDRALASEFEGIFDVGATPACAPFAPNPGAPLADRLSEIERAINCGAIGNRGDRPDGFRARADVDARTAALRRYAGVLRRRARRSRRRDSRSDDQAGRSHASPGEGGLRGRHAARVRAATRACGPREPDAPPDPSAREPRDRAGSHHVRETR